MIPPRRLRDPSKFPLLALLLRFVLLLTMTKAQAGQCTVPKVLWPGSYKLNLVIFNITCTKSTIASVLLVHSKSHEHKLNNFQPFFIENWIQHWILHVGIISVYDEMVQAKPTFCFECNIYSISNILSAGNTFGTGCLVNGKIDSEALKMPLCVFLDTESDFMYHTRVGTWR